ncbi:serine/threonine protein kinase [Chitinophagaceae bacterium LB-8]|uniref:Serine/threonine protein kinase n=1 Tax=Paraflavisolibacter caeni TaxID=2982496 RepID=A0A9X2XWC2_9BACT|nr:serine/threonine-protein kinase [Paraflavisolibacter caeni]MCU7549852.1 serine/threonine protein kinase [Paraflavisolibacter caeni]
MEFRERYQYNTKTDFIAKGGFSRVYKAYDKKLGLTVALKVYSLGLPGKYDLTTEIRHMILLSHPNICRYFDGEVLKTVTALGEEEILQIGVMEYLDGGTIKSYVKSHPEHLSRLLKDVLRGLTYLHQNGIVHRDLNPPNILIAHTASGPIAKITDFNISKVIDETAPLSTQILGKVEYMAPEQFAPEVYGINKKISFNLDLWSFGCVIYELLKGEPLFGSADQQLSTQQVVNNILTGISTERLNQLQEPFRSVVKRCIVRDARSRAQSAEELIEILDRDRDAKHITPNPPMIDPIQPKNNYGVWKFLVIALVLPLLIAFLVLMGSGSSQTDDTGNENYNNTTYDDQQAAITDTTVTINSTDTLEEWP